MKPTYQIFGSKSSEDFDVCFFVDSLDDTKRNHEVVKMYTAQTVFNTSKSVNANLAIVQNGVVVENFKGSADELNNALFTTYHLHDQVYKNHIQRLVSRNLESRIARSARSIIASFTRTDLRTQSKAALRSNIDTQLDFLDQIELKNYTDFGKHGSIIEVYKTMAFQLGMTIALLSDVELYTKEEIIKTFPELENYLLRKEQNSEALQEHLELFITMVKMNKKTGSKMNTQKIIVLSPNFSENSMIINQAAIDTEFTAMRFGSWNLPEQYKKDVVAVYGEDLFTTIIAEQCNLKLLKPADDWLANIPLKYTLRNIIYDRFGNIENVQNKFIKPVDFKFFPAGVYTSVEEIQGYSTIDKNIEVFVSDVVSWAIEVRCFIIDRKVQTWSTYIYNEEIQLKDSMLQNEEREMLNFINKFLADTTVDLPEAVVIDVGYIPNKGWALIEANPVWSSGVYACNPKKVIQTIVRSCEK